MLVAASTVLGGTMAKYQLVSGPVVGNSNRVNRIKWDTAVGVNWSVVKIRNELLKDNTITKRRRKGKFNVKLVQLMS